MPYRIDVDPEADTVEVWDALDALGPLALGWPDGRLAAIMPDAVSPEMVAQAIGGAQMMVSAVKGQDADSVWRLGRKAFMVSSFVIAPPADAGDQHASFIILSDSDAFGTGHHPTTQLCLEALDEAVYGQLPASVLDVGTGSGILAIAALKRGVAQACGIDIDPVALAAAAENARLSKVEDRLRLVQGGPADIDGTWPLVLANVLAAPLIEMAPALVRRVGHRGRLVLSGIPSGVAADVERAYRHVGMGPARATSVAGWTALELIASW